MNKSAIKNFAIWARNKLIADITYKAGLLGISEKEIKEPLPQSTKDVQFFDIGTKEPYSISGVEIKQRDALAEKIRVKCLELRDESKAKSDTLNSELSTLKTAFQAVVEEVAYTWFNRLIAVRFMEVNEYIPSRMRVISSESAGKDEPDLVTNPFDTDLEFTPYEKDRIMQLKRENQLDELFRLLFIKQCNALNAILPSLFEKTSDYTELLLNVAFTDKDGVVYHLVHDIPEDDFNVSQKGQVEIIGWLYQYYNAELNELVYDGNMSKSRIPKELLPAATTIYTPDWAIRYMVENSLGRLWLESHPNEQLKSAWKYYLDEAEQEEDVQKQLEDIREKYKNIKLEDIKVIDPCMGSGHILVYAFDLLMQIYESCGYSQREAAKSIIENNIYGLDIDNRAYQLAYFALMMKARQYNRRILNGETKPNVYAFQESNSINRDQLQYLGAGMEHMQRNVALLQMQGLLDTFMDAKEYGSILNVDSYDWELLRLFVDKLDLSGQLSFDVIGVEDTQAQLCLLVEIGAVMEQKYDVVVTNPPYLGSSRFSPKLAEYINLKYDNAKSDLSMAMYKKAISDFSNINGFTAFITTSSWMFLKSFEKLRRYVLQHSYLDSIVDFGTELFEGKVGHNPIVAWVTRNSLIKKKMTAVRLVEFCYSRRSEKELEFFNPTNRHYPIKENFSKIPGMPIAYWASATLIKTFEEEKNIESVAKKTTKGIYTGNNNKYLRLWYEVSKIQIENDVWHRYSKGGNFRRWYGNSQYVVLWENNAFELKRFSGSGMGAAKYYNFPHIVWSGISTGKASFRYDPDDIFFDDVSPAIIIQKEQVYPILAQLNNAVSGELLKIIAPTMHFQIGDIKLLPVCKIHNLSRVIENVKQNISISRIDWDSFENSWDFVKHPFIESLELRVQSEADKNLILHPKFSTLIKTSYERWENACTARFMKLKANEEELNRIFIDIYGLQDELIPNVEDKDVTICKADLGRDIRSFISYAVGCMFGRYSLDVDGLLFAGGEYSVESGVLRVKYRDESGELRVKCSDGSDYPLNSQPSTLDSKSSTLNSELSTLNTTASFPVDADNIIPITDEEYFEDDVVGLFVAFVKKVYGVETLEENLDFIAKALGNKGDTSREIIRNYFLKDFFKDHCKIYQKRPIYWLFDSGKANGFKALIYMHRYDENTIGNLRIDYLHKMQRVYEREIVRMQETIDNSTNAREVVMAEKRKDKLTKQLQETKDYDEKIAHLALARVAIDLDDGVKVNYEKVQTGTDGTKLEVLAKI